MQTDAVREQPDPWPLALRDRLVAAVNPLPAAALTPRQQGAPLGQLLAGVVLSQHLLHLRLSGTLAALGWSPPAAVRHLQWAPIARSRLEAALAGVPDTLLDGRPFPGEWTVREQLAHVELTDVRYGIATRYAVRRRDDEPLLPPPDGYPARAAAPGGNDDEPLTAILARLRRVRAAALTPLLDLGAADLLRPTEWHNAANTVGFRLHRFAAHDLELTTDLQHTLAVQGYVPTPAMRISAALIAGWGELASLLLGLPILLFTAEPPYGAPTVAQETAALAAAAEDALLQIEAAGL